MDGWKRYNYNVYVEATLPVFPRYWMDADVVKFVAMSLRDVLRLSASCKWYARIHKWLSIAITQGMLRLWSMLHK